MGSILFREIGVGELGLGWCRGSLGAGGSGGRQAGKSHLIFPWGDRYIVGLSFSDEGQVGAGLGWVGMMHGVCDLSHRGITNLERKSEDNGLKLNESASELTR